MKKILIFACLLTTLFINSCTSVALTPAATIRETSVTPSSRNDVIRLNNCSGTSNQSQTVELNRSIKFLSPLTTIMQVEAERLINSLYPNNSYQTRSFEMVVVPGENRDYTVSLFYEIHTGLINEEVQYQVEIPLDLELVSSRSIECSTVVTPTTSAQPSPEVENAEISYLPKTDSAKLDSKKWIFLSYYIGTIEWTYPEKMTIGESASVRLAIIPNNELINLYKLSTEQAEAPKYFYVNENLQLGTTADSSLTGINFSVDTDINSPKSLDGFTPAEWFWNISPKVEGKQSLILHITIPVVLDNATHRQAEINIPIDFNVDNNMVAPTTTPPPSARISEVLVQNLPSILIAIITLLGVILTAVLTYLATIRNHEKTSSQARQSNTNEISTKNNQSKKKKK